MKKILLITLIVVMSFGLIACNSDSSEKSNKSNTSNTYQEYRQLEKEIKDLERIDELIEKYPRSNTHRASELNPDELRAYYEILEILDRNPQFYEDLF